LKNGQIDGALVAIKKSVELKQDNAAGYNNLSLVLKLLNRLEEAEVACRTAIALRPDFAEPHNNLGNILRSLGRLGEAEQHFRQAIVLNPRYSNALVNLGNILRGFRRLNDSVDCYRKAISFSPNVAETYSNLGASLYELGQLIEAENCCRHALRLDPNLAAAHSNLGDVLREFGQLEDAVTSYRNAVRLDPSLPEPFNNLGNAFRRLGKFEEAEHSYTEAIRLNPTLSEAYCNLAWLHLDTGAKGKAFAASYSAYKLKQSDDVKRLLIRCLSVVRFNQFHPEVVDLAIQALENAWSRPTQLVLFSQDLLLQEPRFRKLIDRGLGPSHFDDLLEFLNLLMIEPRFKRLLELTLTSAPLSSFQFERLLTKLRCQMLMNAVGSELSKQSETHVLDFMSVMAQQCYINEYVYARSDVEAKIVLRIQQQISERLKRSETVPEDLILLVACYEPLSMVPSYEYLLASPCSASVKSVLEQQISEPQIELALRAGIPRLTSIEDDVSLAVQSQYEENPYPRWVRLPKVWETKPINQRIQDLFPHANFTPMAPNLLPEILIAGCGTGQQPIEVATLIKDCKVLAVDLSMASLAYAKRKALESCVNNITFAQADILRLGELQCKFDVIESGGVLHHMRDPFAAWDVLLNLLKPKGLMKIGLYSEIARQHVVKLREIIVAEGIASSRGAIAAFRQTLADALKLENFGWISTSNDFYNASGCRDLLFHVNEHRMRLDVIEEYLRTRGLTFLGFEIDQSVITSYQEHFQNDKAAVNLRQWDKFEHENPDTFKGMYQFWVQN
jgi:tetratricopeptide (TPR) repeat protein/2-polyprenyl-3-methyl-5-hydroxy-6-metoxy-1,4-benzoquinol methylase